MLNLLQSLSENPLLF